MRAVICHPSSSFSNIGDMLAVTKPAEYVDADAPIVFAHTYGRKVQSEEKGSSSAGKVQREGRGSSSATVISTSSYASTNSDFWTQNFPCRLFIMQSPTEVRITHIYTHSKLMNTLF
jgi:hypothetical protein